MAAAFTPSTGTTPSRPELITPQRFPALLLRSPSRVPRRSSMSRREKCEPQHTAPTSHRSILTLVLQALGRLLTLPARPAVAGWLPTVPALGLCPRVSLI